MNIALTSMAMKSDCLRDARQEARTLATYTTKCVKKTTYKDNARQSQPNLMPDNPISRHISTDAFVSFDWTKTLTSVMSGPAKTCFTK